MTFPTFANGFVNFLASSNPSSPYYLDPVQLVSNASMVNDMNAMKTGTKNWGPMLVAQNANIPKGGWLLAWSYGVIGNHTGMTIYSGLDADAINNPELNPNDEITELLLELKAPFLTTPDTSCAPTCKPPPLPQQSKPHQLQLREACPDPLGARPRPDSAEVQSCCRDHSHRAARKRQGPSSPPAQSRTGLIRLRVQTRLLRTNHVSRPVVVYSNSQQTKSKFFRLKVDNTPPRLLSLRTHSTGSGRLVSFRVSEKVRFRVTGGGSSYQHWASLARHRLITARLPSSVRHARLILRDRAGNTIVRRLAR